MMLSVVAGEDQSAWSWICLRHFASPHLMPSDLRMNEDLLVKSLKGIEGEQLQGGEALWQDGPEHRLTLPASSQPDPHKFRANDDPPKKRKKLRASISLYVFNKVMPC